MIPPTFQSDLLRALRNHFAWRCSLVIPRDHRYYTSIKSLAEATGMSIGMIRAYLVSETMEPGLYEFDAILQALKITVADLLAYDRQAEYLTLTSSLEAHLTNLLAATDRLIQQVPKHVNQPHASAVIATVGRIQAEVESVAKLHGLVRLEDLPKQNPAEGY